jgi:uncharacterized membrane protein
VRPIAVGRAGRYRKANGSVEGEAMSETFWIIAEITAGIGILGIVSAVITAIMVPFLNKQAGPWETLKARYARGELSREQFEKMRQDMGLGVG